MGIKRELSLATGRRLRAMLVAVNVQKQTIGKTWAYLNELSFLAKSIQIETVCFFTQNLPHPNARSYIGKGKLQELQGYAHAYPLDMVICDDQLTPLQFRNLEKALPGLRILDRGLLMLEVLSRGVGAIRSKFETQLAGLQRLYPCFPQNQTKPGRDTSCINIGKSLLMEIISNKDNSLSATDISHSERQEQIGLVTEVLSEIDTDHVLVIFVYNRIDELKQEGF